MISDTDLREIKRRLSPSLLKIPGVSGVGLPEGKLTIYLAEDSEAVRQKVAALLRSEAPDVKVTYVITGAFRVQ